MMVRDAIILAQAVGNDWTEGQYYDAAEASMESQWDRLIWPIIRDSDFSNVVEIAAGRGRNTAKLAEISQFVTATDINQTNIDALARRFSEISNVAVARNTGADLRFIESGTASFVYSFDAMVHFDSDIVRRYIEEIRRILKPGGRSFCHYSAFDKNPAGSYRDHPGWRNFMSQALFEHWLSKEGFRILQSSYVQGVLVATDNPEGADSVTYFELPNDAPVTAPFEDLSERIAEIEQALNARNARVSELEAELRQVLSSKSWKLTAPLRRVLSALKQ